MSNILFLDIETTGFSRQWDYILELAGIIYNEETKKIQDIFHEYIKPQKKIPQKIIELTGITQELVQYCRNEKSVLEDFVEWSIINKPKKIVGHNCKSFDLGFIREKSIKYNIAWNEDGIEIIDTLVLARQLNKTNKISVDNCQQQTLAKYFNIEYEAHSAIEDVKALISIYEKMCNLNKPKTRADLGF